MAEHGINLRQDYIGYRQGAGACDQELVKDKWHFKNTGQEEADRMTNEEIKRQVMVQPIGAAIFAPGIL